MLVSRTHVQPQKQYVGSVLVNEMVVISLVILISLLT